MVQTDGRMPDRYIGPAVRVLCGSVNNHVIIII